MIKKKRFEARIYQGLDRYKTIREYADTAAKDERIKRIKFLVNPNIKTMLNIDVDMYAKAWRSTKARMAIVDWLSMLMNAKGAKHAEEYGTNSVVAFYFWNGSVKFGLKNYAEFLRTE